MRRLTLLLLPAALFAGQARYARLGEFTGQVDVQLGPADSWMSAERNLPLPESAWLRTAAQSRLEIELDDGSAWRLGPDSQCSLADYTRLSTGQRVTLLWLDRGIAYFTGEPSRGDSLVIAMPGTQAIVTRGARVRFEVNDHASQISVLQGMVRFSSPATEMDLRDGQTTRVEPAYPGRFFFDREITHRDLDDWNQARDKALASSSSALHTPEHYGLVDLDAAGEWIQTDDLGAVWQPKSQEGWIPYRDGHWRWYGALGFTWVSAEPWGWLPYHYGRWTRKDKLGWIWSPSTDDIFKPAEVYWLLGDALAGWGPLAPGEQWNGVDLPAEFLNSNTTFAELPDEARLIDPAGFTARPKEPLKVAAFAVAVPSPSFPATLLDAKRPLVDAKRPLVAPQVTGASFESETIAPTIVLPPQRPPIVIVNNPPPPPPPPEDPPVIVNPLSIVLLSPPPAPATTAAAKPAPTTAGATPDRSHRGPSPHQEPPKATPGRRFHEGEAPYYREVQKSFDANDYHHALTALNSWTEHYPQTDYEGERQFHYVRAYDGVQQPAKVLDVTRTLMAQGLDAALPDTRQSLTVVYLASLNLQKLPRPTRDQLMAGRNAARDLLNRIPNFFVPGSRPQATTEQEWQKMRQAMESVGNSALARAGSH